MAILEENENQANQTQDHDENESDLESEYHSISFETSHPLYLHPSDHPGLILVSTVFNGENYNEWRRLNSDMNDIGEDRISSLPDDVLHCILSFLEAIDAVRTCVLSSRWKLVWTTLPFLNFEFVQSIPKEVFVRTVNNIITRRNQLSNVWTLKLHADDVFSVQRLEKIVMYAIVQGVKAVSVKSIECKSSMLNSTLLETLSLSMDLDKPCLQFLDQWTLPNLRNLHLEHIFPTQCYRRVPKTALSDLNSLTSLTIVRVGLPLSLDLPMLRNLVLEACDLPPDIWNLPSLITLEMVDLYVPSTFNEFLAALVNLKNLKMISSRPVLKDCVITCPQLTNLEVKTTTMAPSNLTPNVVVLSPCIANITISGVILVTCGVLELESVNVNLQDCILDKRYVPGELLKQFYCRLFPMFLGLGGTKLLRIDFDTFEALSTVSDYLELLPSPFHNLNYVKLAQGCKESSIPATLRKYLLGGTPGAAIVTEMPRVSLTKEQFSRPVVEVSSTMPIAYKIPPSVSQMYNANSWESCDG